MVPLKGLKVMIKHVLIANINIIQSSLNTSVPSFGRNLKIGYYGICLNTQTLYE